MVEDVLRRAAGAAAGPLARLRRPRRRVLGLQRRRARPRDRRRDAGGKEVVRGSAGGHAGAAAPVV
eukprot:CAMPEP_0198573412 /NCGR_PEP_ID=MMETSP1462-20131121/113185_1 /TAXON_ID=1333877 /ORGANISM="Brandtodinium nutriculum, Strain RCC3387" /LENGTH=65 /DNA_ID=CAMNT_0044304595 /DNA_START=11 /DNA_END=205 /DNA_ORIENTATION=+